MRSNKTGNSSSSGVGVAHFVVDYCFTKKKILKIVVSVFLLMLSIWHLTTTQQPPLPSSSSSSSVSSTLIINTTMTQIYVSKNLEEYGNKADFMGNKRLFSIIKDVGLNRKESIVLVGGTNNGQSSHNILQYCSNITFYGFEIQKQYYSIAREQLMNREMYTSTTVLNLGWSETDQTNVTIGGTGETAGLYNPNGQRGWTIQNDTTVNTVSLDSWTRKNNIDTVLYVLIDTEGYEPKVIRGMRLINPQNVRKFAMFQYELGGTWATNDQRHNHDIWSQYDTAIYLIHKCGYQLYLIGTNLWLRVNAEFFQEINLTTDAKNPAMQNEGYGPFIGGNILAIHPKYTPSIVVEKIIEHVKWCTSFTCDND